MRVLFGFFGGLQDWVAMAPNLHLFRVSPRGRLLNPKLLARNGHSKSTRRADWRNPGSFAGVKSEDNLFCNVVVEALEDMFSRSIEHVGCGK